MFAEKKSIYHLSNYLLKFIHQNRICLKQQNEAKIQHCSIYNFEAKFHLFCFVQSSGEASHCDFSKVFEAIKSIKIV
jgi:hypothetical protein